MSIITRMLKQKCVYWPLASTESGGNSLDRYGQLQYTDPIEIDCRWENVAKEFVDSQGTVKISQARVFVDRDVQVGEMLLLGELDSGIDNNPKNNEDALEIKSFGKMPNIKASEFLRTVYL